LPRLRPTLPTQRWTGWWIALENIAERGRLAVMELGDDPIAALRAASDRALAEMAAASDDAKVGTPFGEQTLDSYFRFRTARNCCCTEWT
jgi:hypothetical protein